MSHIHITQGNYSGKHQKGLMPDKAIAQAILERAKETKISCKAAEKIAAALGVSMEQVGQTADLLEIQIDKCQLGLFGYRRSKGKSRIMAPSTQVADTLKQAIYSAEKDGKLSCKAAWEIASRLKISKIDVCSAADGLDIKTSQCQLGVF
ncbi:MAG: hypothetical protein QNJ97_21270 [Myxococcota bacterium]|nr:hypothetical protein [Myxococcota bacterium]